MVTVAAVGIALGGATLLAAVRSDQSTPSVRPLSVPTGYRAVSDGLFAYSVPDGWSTDVAYSDNTGDLDTQGRSGWAGEHVGVRTTHPTPDESRPAALAVFGEPKPTAYTLGPATAIRVNGASVAYRYEMTRPAGFRATVVDVWQESSDAELWLVVHASPSVTATLLASLHA